MAEHYGIPADEDIEDVDWLELAGDRGWAVLTQEALGEDCRSRYRMSAAVVEPTQLAAGQHSVFVSGEDPEAKQEVASLLASMGHTDVIDLGDITTARGTEMHLPLWLRLWGCLGTPILNIEVVR